MNKKTFYKPLFVLFLLLFSSCYSPERLVQYDPMVLSRTNTVSVKSVNQDTSERENTRNIKRAHINPKDKNKNIRPKILVLDLDPLRVDDDLAFTMSDVLRDEIHSLGTYEVLSREDLLAIAKREKLQLDAGDCSDEECRLALARALKTKYMVYGSISKIGTLYSISIRLLDTEGKNAGVKNRINEQCKCEEEGLFIAIKKIAGELFFNGV